jgi:hypothetical protein
LGGNGLSACDISGFLGFRLSIEFTPAAVLLRIIVSYQVQVEFTFLMSENAEAAYPRADEGYFHLTDAGWVRHDCQPYPSRRLETWKYELECEAEDAKEQVCLTEVWSDPTANGEHIAALHRQFGEPLNPVKGRNIKFECDV